MIKNYFKTALRSILREKFYSFINLFGLAIGLCVSITILIYVQEEYSYDTFHSKSNEIYRMTLKLSFGNRNGEVNASHPPLAPAVKRQIPEVELATRMFKRDNVIFQNDDKVFKENNVFYVDPEFFELFDFELLAGDANELGSPSKVILTPATAEKYFEWNGPRDALGKLVTINGKEFEVAGIIKEAPANSHFHFNALMGMINTGFYQDDSWESFNVSTYIQLNQNSTIDAVTQKIQALTEQSIPGFEEKTKAGLQLNYVPQALTDIHLHSHLDGEFETNADITYLNIFIGIAIAVILLACINYINLSTARSLGRSKEVGIRKVMGTTKAQLIYQFLSESFLVTFSALLVGLALTELLRVPLSQLSGRELNVIEFLGLAEIGILLLSTVIISVLAGLYPAFVISNFQPSDTLKTKSTYINSGIFNVRNILVILQFTVSAALISSTLIMRNQLSFVQNYDLGFEKENILLIENVSDISNLDGFREKIESYPEVVSTSVSYSKPIGDHDGTQLYRKGNQDQLFVTNLNRVSETYIPTMKMELVLGRGFDKDRASDSAAVILNETAANLYFSEDPVGKELLFAGGERSYTVIGVIKDFNFESLRQSINPMSYIHSERGNILEIRIAEGDTENILRLIREEWKVNTPDQPFAYAFVDQEYDAMFKNEQETSSQIAIFTLLGLVIACMGLLGLAAFMTQKRSREIGIRKSLGASTGGIFKLLTIDFLKLIGISFLISIPLSYYFMDNWLQEFAFRIEIGFIVFLITGLSVVVFALSTIGLQVYKSASSNPVDTLKEP